MANINLLHLSGSPQRSDVFPSVDRMTNLEVLILEDFKFVGSIPQALGRLSKLRRVKLVNCNLNGAIPNLSNSSIEELHLIQNKLSGTIAPMPQTLRSLQLAFNKLMGPLDNIFGLDRLEALDLSQNEFSGNFFLPSGIAQRLRQLKIYSNQFSSVSLNQSDWSALKICDMHDNDFTCPAPDWLREKCLIECK